MYRMADDPLAVALEEENPCTGGVLPEDKCNNIIRRYTNVTKNGCLCKFEGKEGRALNRLDITAPWFEGFFNVDWVPPEDIKENWCEVKNKDAPGCAASFYNDLWYDWVDRSREALPDEKEFEKTCLAHEQPRCEVREGVCRGRPRIYGCPACLGEKDPILLEDIVSSPVCAHGKCYGALSLAKALSLESEIPHSGDPYTLDEFFEVFDSIGEAQWADVRTEQKNADEARQAARNAKQEANEARQAVFNAQQAAREVINEARQATNDAQQKADEARQATNDAQQKADEARQAAYDALLQAAYDAQQKADEAADEARQAADEAQQAERKALQEAGEADRKALQAVLKALQETGEARQEANEARQGEVKARQAATDAEAAVVQLNNKIIATRSLFYDELLHWLQTIGF